MNENQELCPACRGVVEDGVCTICGQEIVKDDAENEEEFVCPICKRPESNCICGE